MKNIKHRITKMEHRVVPAPPAVICATSREDAELQIAELRKQHGDHIRPFVLIAPDIIKTE